MSGLVQYIPEQYIYAACAGLLSAVLALVALVVKYIVSEVLDAKDKVYDIAAELTLQRTNCLSTLQRQGEKQIVVLERIAESVSYLKGKAD